MSKAILVIFSLLIELKLYFVGHTVMVGGLVPGRTARLLIKIPHRLVVRHVNVLLDHDFIVLVILIFRQKHVVNASLYHSSFFAVFESCEFLVIFLLILA